LKVDGFKMGKSGWQNIRIYTKKYHTNFHFYVNLKLKLSEKFEKENTTRNLMTETFFFGNKI